MHVAEAYAGNGYHIIPVETGGKRPSTLLPERKWKSYQDEAPSPEEIQGWVERNKDGNWGLVCQRGECCGDCDDPEAAAWILADPTRDLFRGACVVRSGHGKAHIWFRYTGDLQTTIWRMSPGRKMGDVRTYGSYVLVPPSRLADGGVYERMAGSMETLPTVPDPEQFLAAIVNAFRTERRVLDAPSAPRKPMDVLSLSADEAGEVRSRVSQAGFKKNIRDTLLTPGHQTPGTLYWHKLASDSHSEIDFAVCCEFYRKGWSFEDTERVFAATLIGEACYRNQSRPHHGYSYLVATWNNAVKAVEADRAAQKQPQGANFEVAQASRLERGKDPLYTLTLRWSDGTVSDAFDVPSSRLIRESSFAEDCFHATRRAATFKASQGGKEYRHFAEAVARLSDADVRHPPHEFTEAGRLQARIRRVLLQMASATETPDDRIALRRLGWRQGDEYWVRPTELQNAMENTRVAPKLEDVWHALEAMTQVQMVTLTWPDAPPEQFMYFRLQPAF